MKSLAFFDPFEDGKPDPTPFDLSAASQRKPSLMFKLSCEPIRWQGCVLQVIGFIVFTGCALTGTPKIPPQIETVPVEGDQQNIGLSRNSVEQVAYVGDVGSPSLDREHLFATDALLLEQSRQGGMFIAPTHELSLMQKLAGDHTNYYSPANLAELSGLFAIGALVANTSLDREIYEDFNNSIRDAPNDEWFESFHAPKELGNGMYTLPVFAAAWGVSKLARDSEAAALVGQWGEDSLRTFLVGAPPLLVMQKVIGAGRPEEGDSHWQFWQDNNGVSGHSFMGAMPFLTAAQVSENRLMKVLFYAGSSFVPLSRISDGDHYASQAFLGWGMALAAARSVAATNREIDRWQVVPLLSPDSFGFAVATRW